MDRAEAERLACVVCDHLEYEQSINDPGPAARNVDRVTDALIAYGKAQWKAGRDEGLDAFAAYEEAYYGRVAYPPCVDAALLTPEKSDSGGNP